VEDRTTAMQNYLRRKARRHRWTADKFDNQRDPAWPNEERLDERGKADFFYPSERDQLFSSFHASGKFPYMTCRRCRRELVPSNFSRSQQARKDGERTCLTCQKEKVAATTTLSNAQHYSPSAKANSFTATTAGKQTIRKLPSRAAIPGPTTERPKSARVGGPSPSPSRPRTAPGSMNRTGQSRNRPRSASSSSGHQRHLLGCGPPKNQWSRVTIEARVLYASLLCSDEESARGDATSNHGSGASQASTGKGRENADLGLKGPTNVAPDRPLC